MDENAVFEPKSAKPARTLSVGGFSISRQPGKRLTHLHAKIALVVGIILTAFHDLVYRSTGGTDFEIYGLISHAGSDMLVVTLVIAFVLLFVPSPSSR